MKLYHFQQYKNVYEAWDSFDAIADSKEEAFQIFLDKMKNDPDVCEDDYEKDISVYSIKEYDLNKKVCIPHYSRG